MEVVVTDPAAHAFGWWTTFTVLCAVVAGCFLAPPPAFHRAGVTVEGLFEPLLGSCKRDFVAYQCRRTLLTVLSHVLLAAGYACGNLYYVFAKHPLPSSSWFTAALTVPSALVVAGSVVAIVYLVYIWGDLRRHWIFARACAHDAVDPVRIISSIDQEVRESYENLIPVGTQTLFITPSWILKPTAYTLDIAHQRDVDLVVQGVIDVRDPTVTTMGTAEALQLMTIKVASVRLAQPFYIRIFASDFHELQGRLNREVRNAQSIILRQTPDEVFLSRLRERVRANCIRAGLWPLPDNALAEDDDRCVGCMSAPANIRLRHLCGTARGCNACFCRPMWCLDCFGRWFLSRQDPRLPESWLDGTCTCPTCHARFCLDDIIAVRRDAIDMSPASD